MSNSPEFDQVFVVRSNGQWYPNTYPGRNLFVPSVYGETDPETGFYEETIDSDDWEFVSEGMTGQYGYNGPVLHPSEYYSEGMYRRLLELHDDYDAFANVAVWDVDSNGEDIVGWVIVGHKRS